MYIHSEISAGTLSDNPFPFCSCEHCLPLQTDKMIVGDVEPTEADLVAMQQTIHTIEEPQAPQQQQQPQAPIRQVVQTASGKQQTLYSCSVCNKSTFKTEHRLRKHMRIHRNEQPFSCDICHKVYNASSSLKTHQRQVHGGVTNSTSATNVTASNQTSDNMDKSATGVDEQTVIDGGGVVEATAQCSICLKTFAKAQQLNVHMSTAHAMTTTATENDEEDPNGADKISDIAME